MEDLRDYILAHTGVAGCGSREYVAVDVGFGAISVAKDAPADTLKELIAGNYYGDQHQMDPLDGEFHDLNEIGAWLGDQGLALRFMALTKAAGAAELVMLREIGLAIIETDAFQKIKERNQKPAGPSPRP